MGIDRISRSQTNLKRFLPVVPALVVYGLLAKRLLFIQDDAFISYRYVANFLNGHGLVYNIGERIEGYTNFGWQIFLIMWGALGGNYIFISQITGFILGAGFIVLTYLIAELVFAGKDRMFVYVPVYLVGANLSLAYWSPAGLETACFAFLAALALYWYLRRSRLLIAALTLAVWVRPEGAVVAGILMAAEAVETRRLPWFALRSTLVAFVFSLPFVVFKLAYYGSIFPNPFFAKTGLHLDQLLSGLEYAGQFLSHYGFWGVGFVIPLFFYRRLSAAEKTIWTFSALFTLYLILIGGDVLKVHRFFLPIFGTTAMLFALSLSCLVEKWHRNTRYLVVVVVMIPALALTFYLPRKVVFDYNLLERRFTKKMEMMAERIKAADSTNFSVALSTIGRFGYDVLGHDIIDMVGLTDSTIARHSEPPVPGMQTTWKEKRHNAKYILERGPDYILFSTGIKPSAPAERALYLYRQFVEAYESIGWYFKIEETDPSGLVFSMFKKMREVKGDLVPYYPIEYVQLYKEGLDAYVRGDYRAAISFFNKSLKASPQPYNLQVIYQKAFCHMLLGQHDIAEPLLEDVVRQDSLVFQAHRDLYLYALLTGNQAKADIHKRWIMKLVPWYWPQIEQYVNQQVRSLGGAGKPGGRR